MQRNKNLLHEIQAKHSYETKRTLDFLKQTFSTIKTLKSNLSPSMEKQMSSPSKAEILKERLFNSNM